MSGSTVAKRNNSRKTKAELIDGLEGLQRRVSARKILDNRLPFSIYLNLLI
jgi:hypothetical protein